MVGPGAVDYGWIGVFPFSFQMKTNFEKEFAKIVQKKYSFRSKFSHKDEIHEPGFY